MPKKFSSAVRRFARLKNNKVVSFLRRQPAINYAFFAAVVILVSYAGYFVVIILSKSLMFNGFAADGAFQALNPMRRLAEGYVIGADFNTFHGVGMSLLHLPFYYLFGQGLFASEISRQLLAPLLFVFSTYLFMFVTTKNKKIATIASAVVLAIAGANTAMMTMFVLPFTSMLGVRSVLTVFAAILMIRQERLRTPLIKKVPYLNWLTKYEFWMAITLVAGLLSGTEFGVAAIIAFTLVHMLYKIGAGTWKQRLLSLVRVGIVFIVSLMLILTIVTHGQPLTPLVYAFQAIPADQFWYFGAPPNTFLHQGNIVKVLTEDTSLHILIFYAVAGTVCTLILHRLKAYRVQVQAFVFMLIAGILSLVSMLGYYFHSQALSLGRLGLLIAVASIIMLWMRYADRVKIDIALAVARKKMRIRTAHVLTLGAIVFIAWSFTLPMTLAKSAAEDNDVVMTLRKTKAFILGKDTNILDTEWSQDDSMITPVIQQDNYVKIPDINEGDFVHGVAKNSAEVIVEAGGNEKFIRHGQIVFFKQSGRQLVLDVYKYGDKYLRVTLQNEQLRLIAEHDGAPQNLIVAEDFKGDDKKVWSLYTSLTDAEMGVLNPSSQKADYVIHALGQDLRKQYVEDFDNTKPEYVVTLRKYYFGYEEWLQNASWDLYSMIDANYEPAGEGPIHVVWKRKDQPWVKPLDKNEGWEKLDIAGPRINLPAVDFSKLPDVNQYTNDMREKEAEQKRANGDPNAKAIPLLPLDSYIESLAPQQTSDLLQKMREEDGQGYNTTPFGAGLGRPTVGEKTDVAQPRRAVVLVKLRYETKNPLEKVPLLGKTARFLVEPSNTYSHTQVSLPSYKNEIVFPVILSELNSDSFLTIKNYALLPTTPETKIISAEWRLLETGAANLKILTDYPGPRLQQP